MQQYSVLKKRKYTYVCKNNGQFHIGNMCNFPGYATFIGKFLNNDPRLNYYLEI